MSLGGGPHSVMVTLLTLKQEVWGSNPCAPPPKFGAHTPPYYPASRSQRRVKGPLKGWWTQKPSTRDNKKKCYYETSQKFSHLLPLFLLSHDVDGNVVLFLIFLLIRRLPGLVLPPAVLVVAVLAPSGAAALLILILLVEFAAAFEVVVVPVVRVPPAPLSASSSVAAGVVAAAAVAGVVPAVAATIYAKKENN